MRRSFLFLWGILVILLAVLDASSVSASPHAASGNIQVDSVTLDPNNDRLTRDWFGANPPQLMYQYECDNYQGQYGGVFPYTGACYFYAITVTFTTQHADPKNTMARIFPGDIVTVHVVADPTSLNANSPHLCPDPSGDPGQDYNTSGCNPNWGSVHGFPAVSHFAQWAFFSYSDSSGNHKTGLCPGNPSYRPYPTIDAYACTGNGSHLEGIIDETYTVTLPATASQICGGYDGDGAHVFTSYCKPVTPSVPEIATDPVSPGTYGDGVAITGITETLGGNPYPATLSTQFFSNQWTITSPNGSTNIGAEGDPTGVVDAGTYQMGIWDAQTGATLQNNAPLTITINQAASQVVLDTSQPGYARVEVNPAIGASTAAAKGMRMPTGKVSVVGPSGTQIIDIGGTYPLPSGTGASYPLTASYLGDQDYAPSSTDGSGSGTGSPTGGMNSNPHEYGTTNGFGIVNISAVCDKPPPPQTACTTLPDGTVYCYPIYQPAPPCHGPGGSISFTTAFGSMTVGYSSSVTFDIPAAKPYPHVGTYPSQACYSGDDQHSGLCVSGSFTIIPAHAQIAMNGNAPTPDTIGVPYIPLSVTITTDTVPLEEGTITFTTANCSQGPCGIVVDTANGASSVSYNWTPLPPQQPGTMNVDVEGTAEDYIFDTSAIIPVTIYPAQAEIDNPPGKTVYGTASDVIYGRYGIALPITWNFQSWYWDGNHHKQYLTDIPLPKGTMTIAFQYTSWDHASQSTSQQTIPVENGQAQWTFAATNAAGIYLMNLQYSGDVYHYSAGKQLEVDILPQTSVLTPTGPQTSVYGHSVPESLTVQLLPDAQVGGAVSISVDGATVQTWLLQSNPQTFNVLLQKYDAGNHIILWTYAGSNDALGGEVSVPLTITPAPTILSLASNLNPSYDGQMLTFMPAIVASPALESWAIPITGWVRYIDGGKYINANWYSPGDIKEWSQEGTRQVEADYQGNLDYLPSSGSVVQVGLKPGALGFGASMRLFVADAGGPVDLAIDGHVVVTDVQYDTLVPYFSLSPGQHTLTAYRNSTTTVLVSGTFNWNYGDYQTVMITGPGGQEKIVAILDNLQVPQQGGSVRVYNAVWTETLVLGSDGGQTSLDVPLFYDTASAYAIEPYGSLNVTETGQQYQRTVSFWVRNEGLYSIFLIPDDASVRGGAPPSTQPPQPVGFVPTAGEDIWYIFGFLFVGIFLLGPILGLIRAARGRGISFAPNIFDTDDEDEDEEDEDDE